MNGWKDVTLGEIAPLSYGKSLSTPNRRPGAIPVYSSAGITGAHDEALVSAPSVIVGRKGNVGSVYFAVDDCFPIDTAFYTKGSSAVDLRFLYYKLLSLDLKDLSRDSAVPGLQRAEYSSYGTTIPRVSEQMAIASILSALDDKITSNVKLTSASAQLAMTLLAEATKSRALNVPISEAAILLTRGITPSYTELESTSMPVLNQKCVRDHRVDTSLGRRTRLDRVRSEKVLRQDDVLVNSTGQGTLGRVARWTGEGRVTVDSHITIVRFDPTKVDPTVGGYAMLAVQPAIEALGEGSTGQTELSRAGLGRLQLALPPLDVARTLGRDLAKLGRLEATFIAENQALAHLRDALLPELMSGRLRVKDAEKKIEEVV